VRSFRDRASLVLNRALVRAADVELRVPHSVGHSPFD